MLAHFKNKTLAPSTTVSSLSSYRRCYVEQVDQGAPPANRSNGGRYLGPRGDTYRRQAVLGRGLGFAPCFPPPRDRDTNGLTRIHWGEIPVSKVFKSWRKRYYRERGINMPRRAKMTYGRSGAAVTVRCVERSQKTFKSYLVRNTTNIYSTATFILPRAPPQFPPPGQRRYCRHYHHYHRPDHPARQDRRSRHLQHRRCHHQREKRYHIHNVLKGCVEVLLQSVWSTIENHARPNKGCEMTQSESTSLSKQHLQCTRARCKVNTSQSFAETYKL